MNLSIKEIQSAMNTEVERLGGIDAAIEACDRMYQASFRGEGVKLSSFADWEDEIHSIDFDLGKVIYKAKTGGDISLITCDAEFEYHADCIDCLEGLPVITGDTIVTVLCNYKGEGGDLVYFDLVEHLPVFKSKYESFNQVN